jgi:Acyl-CoA dehydrogenases
MELLAEFGSPDQQAEWLIPLLEGRIRSAFCMTEPDVASSDATNIATAITPDGDGYVINGRKWWSSGAMSSDCKIFIVMGVTGEPGAAGERSHSRHSMILVPRETPGITVKRGMRVFGYTDGTHGGHAEVVFDNVRVPRDNLISGEGAGFAIAQARLGPGRIHHCMRQIGAAERALELMCRRAVSRTAFGKPLAEQGVDPGLDRRVQGADRAGAAARAQDRVADGHGRQQGGALRDPGDQDRYPGDGAVGDRPGDPGARRWRRQPGLPAGPPVGQRPHAPVRRRPGRGAQAVPGPPRAAESH